MSSAGTEINRQHMLQNVQSRQRDLVLTPYSAPVFTDNRHNRFQGEAERRRGSACATMGRMIEVSEVLPCDVSIDI